MRQRVSIERSIGRNVHIGDNASQWVHVIDERLPYKRDGSRQEQRPGSVAGCPNRVRANNKTASKYN